MEDDNKIKSVFRQKTTLKRYSTWEGHDKLYLSRDDEGTDIDVFVATGHIDKPILEVGENFYLNDSVGLVNINNVCRSIEGVVYYISPNVTEDEKTRETHDKAMQDIDKWNNNKGVAIYNAKDRCWISKLFNKLKA